MILHGTIVIAKNKNVCEQFFYAKCNRKTELLDGAQRRMGSMPHSYTGARFKYNSFRRDATLVDGAMKLA